MSATLVRLLCFVGALLLFGALEYRWPWRPEPGWRHKSINLGMIALGSIGTRLAIPISLIEVAILVRRHGLGLLHLVTLPGILLIIAGVVLLDLIIYGQHMAFHYTPVLWRLHRVHHTDPSLDVTTGVRFHPLEIIVSTIVKGVAILLLGITPMAVAVFEVILNVSSVFNHANLRLPDFLERLLRLLIVTPGMHRVHHSAVDGELNHNFGFNLSWWDRLFRTYLGRSRVPEAGMPVGLPGRVGDNPGFAALLLLPFRRS